MAKLFFFSPLSDALEIESRTMPFPKAIGTIQDLVTALPQRGTRWQRYRDTDQLQVIRNRQFYDALAETNDSDEIAFISRLGSIQALA